MNEKTISMNKSAIVDLVLFGKEERVEVLFRALNGTMQRLGKSFKGRGFRKAPTSEGPHPNPRACQRWLDSLCDSEHCADDVEFMCKLYYTCRGRVRPDVLKELEK